MNAVQFGRWFSEQRRACGWSSQRLLAEEARHHSHLNGSGISEDFLARLEAGHLAFPFRGTVRRRVLALAWLLCNTSRDLKTYLKAAALSDLSGEEQKQLLLLSEHLTSLKTPPPLLLLPRPARLVGRQREVEQLKAVLHQPGTRAVAVTGMPGIGKSALVREVLYQLVYRETAYLGRFPDGIVALVCSGRKGIRGLLSLLAEINALFALPAQDLPVYGAEWQGHLGRFPAMATPELEQGEDATELAAAIDRTRRVLAHKRVLFFFDDLDPSFPLSLALDALLVQGEPGSRGALAEAGYERRAVLITSRFVPPPAAFSSWLPLRPLSEEAALNLLFALLGRDVSARDQDHARQACARVGYLPQALESIATAVQVQGLPLELVAIHLATRPAVDLLDVEEELKSYLHAILAQLGKETRAVYLLLAALGLVTFDLEAAALITQPQPLSLPGPREGTVQSGRGHLDTLMNERPPECVTRTPLEWESARMAHLADTAAMLGQCVRYALLERLPDIHETVADSGEDEAWNLATGTQIRSAPGQAVLYRVPPLLRLCALPLARTLSAERLAMAQHNFLRYALSHVSWPDQSSLLSQAPGQSLLQARRPVQCWSEVEDCQPPQMPSEAEPWSPTTTTLAHR